jgi:hypothetical protein
VACAASKSDSWMIVRFFENGNGAIALGDLRCVSLNLTHVLQESHENRKMSGDEAQRQPNRNDVWLDGLQGRFEPVSMVPESITTWLVRKRRTEFTWTAFYSVLACVTGGVVLALTFGFIFIGLKVFLLITIPSANDTNAVSGILASVLVVFICVDTFRASRDDMSILPLWLAREYLHFGPRVMMDGIREGARARRFSRIDIPACAEVLSYLAQKDVAVARPTLEKIFPKISWALLVDQLSLFEGVLFFQPDSSKVILTMPLRLELRGMIRKRVEPREEEPTPTPVVEPEKIMPCDLLGVSATASLAEIKAAYRNRIKECHPDRFAGMDERARAQAEEWTKALNMAYHTLMAQRVQRKM